MRDCDRISCISMFLLLASFELRTLSMVNSSTADGAFPDKEMCREATRWVCYDFLSYKITSYLFSTREHSIFHFETRTLNQFSFHEDHGCNLGLLTEKLNELLLGAGHPHHQVVNAPQSRFVVCH